MNDPEVTMLNATRKSNLIARETALEAAGMAIQLVLRVPSPLKSLADQVVRAASSVADHTCRERRPADVGKGVEEGGRLPYIRSPVGARRRAHGARAICRRDMAGVAETGCTTGGSRTVQPKRSIATCGCWQMPGLLTGVGRRRP
jgi:hypothetical protein